MNIESAAAEIAEAVRKALGNIIPGDEATNEYQEAQFSGITDAIITAQSLPIAPLVAAILRKHLEAAGEDLPQPDGMQNVMEQIRQHPFSSYTYIAGDERLREIAVEFFKMFKEFHKLQRDSLRAHKVFDILGVPECKVSNDANQRLLDRSVVLAGEVRKLRAAPPERQAGGEEGKRFALVVEYPDGSEVVYLPNGDCNSDILKGLPWNRARWLEIKPVPAPASAPGGEG